MTGHAICHNLIITYDMNLKKRLIDGKSTIYPSRTNSIHYLQNKHTKRSFTSIHNKLTLF